MTPEERNLLRDLYDRATLLDSIVEQDRGLLTDPPDLEWQNLCRRVEEALGEPRDSVAEQREARP